MDLIVPIVKSQLKKTILFVAIIKITIKNYFIHYYIETFLSCNNFFDILLVFVFFLQTYYDTYSSRILFFYFFLLQISFYIYLLLVLLISLYHFHQHQSLLKYQFCRSYSTIFICCLQLTFYVFHSYKVSSRKTCR